jgi:predicted ATPase
MDDGRKGDLIRLELIIMVNGVGKSSLNGGFYMV